MPRPEAKVVTEHNKLKQAAKFCQPLGRFFTHSETLLKDTQDYDSNSNDGSNNGSNVASSDGSNGASIEVPSTSNRSSM